VAKWIVDSGAEHGLDAAHVAVAGDSVGGTIAAALTLLAMQRPARPSPRSCSSTR
jgi:acetyl esterase/lipase